MHLAPPWVISVLGPQEAEYEPVGDRVRPYIELTNVFDRVREAAEVDLERWTALIVLRPDAKAEGGLLPREDEGDVREDL